MVVVEQCHGRAKRASATKNLKVNFHSPNGGLSESAHPSVRITFGRGGGSSSSSSSSYPLPGGGRLKFIDVGSVGGNRPGGGSGSLTVSALPTSELAANSPPLQEQELLVSPVYRVAMNLKRSSQRPRLSLTLPLLRRPLPSTPPTQRLRLASRSEEEAVGDGAQCNWLTVDVAEEDNKSVTCHVTSSGIYVAVLSPLSETFQVTPGGGLLNLKLDPIISVRIPKRGCLESAECCLSIISFSDERLSLARRTNPSQMMDIRSLSPVYNFDYSGGEFKRPITLKLPLPHWLSTPAGESPDLAPSSESPNLTIFYQPKPGLTSPWRILDPGGTVKLTKNSVSFEAKHLTRYCLASVDSAKAQRASLAMPLLCGLNNAVEGEILLFARLRDRQWRLCVDCTPRNEIVDRISDRVQNGGWQYLQSLQQLQQQQQQQQSGSASSFRRRPYPRRQAAADNDDSRRGSVRLRNGAIFLVQLAVNSDLALSQEPESADEAAEVSDRDNQPLLVQYHQLLSESPAVFRLAPTERCRTAARDFFDYLLQQGTGELGEKPAGDAAAASAVANTETTETLLFKSQICVVDESGDAISEHEISVDFNVVKTYLGLRPPTPPPPPTPSPLPMPSPPPPTQRGASTSTITKRIPQLPRLRLRVNELDPAQARMESFQRLTAPRRNLPAPVSTRESKVLSVRSLQTLSEQVRQGLTLAVHLSLPESAITGIGFDVLSGGSSLSGVTYKILTHWKRSVPLSERSGMAQRLADALARTGRPDLARAVLHCDATNCELTPALLSAAFLS